MLPPFRIRNLRRPSSPPGQQLGQSPPKGCYDAIVRITAPQYDLTVTTHPEATLKYVDEDREVITVGSSLELVERLHEPVILPTKRPQPSQVAQKHAAPPPPAHSHLSPSFGPRAGQEPSVIHANNLLMSYGVNPLQLSESQFQTFQQQNPQVQQKTIEIYAQNLQQHQRGVSAGFFRPRQDPCTPLQARDMLMQHAKNLVTRADQQTEASSLQNVQDQQRVISEKAQLHVFDLDNTSQNALTIWREIQSKSLMDLELERAGKASEDVQSHPRPPQNGYSLGTFSGCLVDATGGQPEIMNCDQALPPARDERQYYFEITNPPQLNRVASMKAVNSEGLELGEILANESTPLLELDHETNLTVEGRRQAEAAGDKMRARCNPLYKPMDAPGSHVPDIYQNRWASYSQGRPPSQNSISATTNETPCIPPIAADAHKPNKSLLEVFEDELAKLSSDAQKPKPSEGLDTATSLVQEKDKKPRRISEACSYCRKTAIRCFDADADPQGRCSNCISLKKECKFITLPPLGLAVDPPTSVPSIEPTGPSREPAPIADPPISVSFVEPSAPANDSAPIADPPTSVPYVELNAPGRESAPIVDPGELLAQTIKSLVDGVGSFTTELRSQVSEAQVDAIASSQNVSHALEHGLMSAFKGFASCVQNIAETVQNASGATRHAADRTRAIDTQILEGAVRGLQGLAGGITAFGRDLVPADTRTAPPNHNDAASELTAHVREDTAPSSVNDQPVNTPLPAELLQPSPKMKNGPSTKFLRPDTLQNHEIHEATEGTRIDSQRPDHGSPVSALSEGLRELSKTRNRGVTEAKREYQDCTACSSLWPDRCYWHESATPPYKSDTMERGRQSRRSTHRSSPALAYEYVVPPPAFRVKEHLVHDTHDRDRTPHGSRRSRSRSPPVTSSRRVSPTRRSSPSGWPRFHGPGPIHLPQDVPDSIHQRREGRLMWRSRRQQTPRLSDGPLLRRGNEYPAYLRPKTLVDSVANKHGDEFVPFGGQGRHYQQRTFEQSARNNLTDRYRPRAGEDQERPIPPPLNFTLPLDHATQPRALRHHQSTPALGRPHRSFDANRQTVKMPVRTHGIRNELASETSLVRPHRRAVARDPPRRCAALEEVEDMSGDFHSTLDRAPAGAHKRGASNERNESVDSQQDTLSSPVATHFPTLEQFEVATFTGPPRFPPLPSMEPLIPSRPENRGDDSQECRSGDYKPIVAKAADPTTPKVYPSAWPHPVGESHSAESSGDFFKRMTGLTETSEMPVYTTPAPLDFTAPEARLMKPFDPLADTKPRDIRHDPATSQVPQLSGGVRRSNTVADLGGRYHLSNRRPYSEFFSGDGRIGWDTFVKGYEGGPSSTSAVSPEPRHAQAHTFGPEAKSMYSNMVTVDNSSASVVNRPESNPTAVGASVNAAGKRDAHQDSPGVRKVQECVEQLAALGFGTQENGGPKRLVLYAQAAEGDLEEAIEMIEEERTAYKQRFF